MTYLGEFRVNWRTMAARDVDLLVAVDSYLVLIDSETIALPLSCQP